MNRVIKFRAWDKKEKRMYEWPFITHFFDEKIRVHKEGYGYIHIPMDDIELLQLTGLKDRNGKEIYEGDIMSVLDRDWPSGDYTNQTPKEYMKKISSVCEVVYEPTEFYLKQIKGRGYFYPQMTGITHRDIFEVIGNIYENPELLK